MEMTLAIHITVYFVHKHCLLPQCQHNALHNDLVGRLANAAILAKLNWPLNLVILHNTVPKGSIICRSVMRRA